MQNYNSLVDKTNPIPQNLCSDKAIYLKKVNKVSFGNNINRLTIKKLEDYITQEHPNYKNYHYYNNYEGDYHVKTEIEVKTHKNIEFEIKDPENYTKIVHDFSGWTAEEIFAYSRKEKLSLPDLTYTQKVEVIYQKKKKYYINTETGEPTPDNITKSINALNYLKQPSIPCQINGKASMLTNTYKLNSNAVMRKRNKLIKIYSDYYSRDITKLLSEGYSIKHLVLTVPHTLKNGYKGEKFFHSKLLSDWNHFRKRKDFKKYF